MQEVVKIEAVKDLRVAAGQTEAKIKNSAAEFNSTPENGVFSHIGIKEFDIPNVGKRSSVGLYLTDGQFVSENAINQQNLLSEMTEIKNGTRKGKFMLKSNRLTDLSKLGSSADLRLVALQGKSFSTTKNEIRVYKSEFLSAENFDKVCQTTKSESALKKALDCTEGKNGYIFIIE